MESFKVGKVRVEQIAPNVFKLVCSPWVWWTGRHFEKAISELSKKHKILCIITLVSCQNYELVIVE